ncbi:MAG TPA: hypothetical protein VJC21_02770 [Candidatus Nanoarchaeia archaeon]|nr:hypothetical protein [Candidatus Nanoarchaeia archaeon]
MNKKAMLDDLFDFLFTVIVFFFILLFVQGFIVGGAEARERRTNTLVERTALGEDFLVAQQVQLPQGEAILLQELDENLRTIRTIAPEEQPIFRIIEGLR